MINQHSANQQSTQSITHKELKVFNNQYVVHKKLSSGSFGVVFQGEDRLTGETIALKIEKEEKDEAKSLDRESHILSRLQGIRGIPKLYWIGQEGSYNVMVIQLLGRDLAYYVKHLKKFSLKTLLMLAEQIVTILEQSHNKSVIHRDMKPENVLVGRNPTDVYLVDFGISKIYKDNKGGHIPFRDNKPFIGTTRYASIAAHKGHELGRSDDLESLGYMLVFLFRGQLPWQNLQNVSDKDKTKIVGRMKMQMDVQELCKDLPIQFCKYFEYVKSLQFKDQPDYKLIIALFRKCGQENKIEFDNQYDWVEMEKRNADKQASNDSKYKSKLKQQSQSQQRIPKSTSGDSEKFRQQNPAAQDKKSTLVINELGSNGQIHQSQFDFLKPPDPYSKARGLIQRTKEKHQSISSLAPSQYSQANTYLSSVANQYQPSYQQLDLEGSPKHDLLNSAQNFGFQPLDRNDTMGIEEDDEDGPETQYRILQEQSVRATFKSGFQQRNREYQ